MQLHLLNGTCFRGRVPSGGGPVQAGNQQDGPKAVMTQLSNHRARSPRKAGWYYSQGSRGVVVQHSRPTSIFTTLTALPSYSYRNKQRTTYDINYETTNYSFLITLQPHPHPLKPFLSIFSALANCPLLPNISSSCLGASRVPQPRSRCIQVP
jgi:hypothetical protein